MSKLLTPDELDKLKEYIAQSRRLKAEMPVQEQQVETEADFYQRVDEWERKWQDLNNRYHDNIVAAIRYHISNDGDGGDVLKIINEIVAAAIEEAKTFSTIRQGTATNALTKVNSILGRNTVIDQFTGAATVTEGDFTITFPHFESIGGLKTSTHRLLDVITVVLTESGAKSPTVSLSLTEYMEKCGLKDRKEARKQAEEDLETLFDARISYKEKNRAGQPGGFADARICEAKGISRDGIISFKFSDTLYQTLLRSCTMPYPQQLWRLNSKRNPNSYYFLRKIAEQKNMNVGKASEDIIAVKTLLAASPAMPTHRSVAAKDRHFSRSIIEPFERDMNALEDTLVWEYCHSKGAPLTDEELQNFNYELFKTLLLKITWKQYPDQTARLERAEQRKAERAAADKKKGAKRGVKHRRKGGNAPQ